MEEDSVALHVLGVIQAELDGGVGIHHRSDGIFVLVRAYTTTHRLDADLAADAEFHHAIPIVFFENEGLDVRVELGQRRVMVRRAEIVAEIDGAARVLGQDLLLGEVDVLAAGDDQIDVDAAEATAGAELVVEGLVLSGEVAEG